MDLFNELVNVIHYIKPRRYLLIGGLAYSIYAKPRFTQDIDFIICEDDYDAIDEILTVHNFLGQKTIMKFAQAKIARFVKMEGENALILDFLIDKKKDFNGFYKKRNTIVQNHVEIELIGIDDLIRLKKNRNSKQDQLDIDELKKVKRK